MSTTGFRDQIEELLRVQLDDSDPDARDVEFIARTGKPFCDWLSQRYFRVEIEGLEHVPEPPFIAVAIHSGGALLADVWPILSAWWDRFPPEQPAYALVHDAAFRVPLVRNLLIKLGALRACTENAELALDRGAALMIFPGGDSDAQRSFWRRNTVDFKGRTGFIRLALRHGVPIVPVVNVGGAEVAFTVVSSRKLATWTGLRKAMRVDTLPITVGLPWGVWPTGFIPYLPLPSKIIYRIGPPIGFPQDERLAEHPQVLRHAYGEVVGTMQSMVDELAAQRRFPVLG